MSFLNWKMPGDIRFKSPFDIFSQRKEPLVLFTSLLFLGFLSALIVDGLFFVPPPVVSILAVDVSESAINSEMFPASEICALQRLSLLPEDEQIDVWFADRSSLIGRQQVERTHQRLGCHLPPSDEELEVNGLGKSPGTSLKSAVQLSHLEAQKRRSLASNLPIVVVIALHEVEPIPSEEVDVSSLIEALQELAEVADEILLVGPKGELARELNRLSLEVKGVKFCAFRDLKQVAYCLEKTFEKGRERGH